MLLLFLSFWNAACTTNKLPLIFILLISKTDISKFGRLKHSVYFPIICDLILKHIIIIVEEDHGVCVKCKERGIVCNMGHEQGSAWHQQQHGTHFNLLSHIQWPSVVKLKLPWDCRFNPLPLLTGHWPHYGDVIKVSQICLWESEGWEEYYDNRYTTVACRNATETVACTGTCIIIMWRQTDSLYVKLRLVFDIVYIFERCW